MHIKGQGVQPALVIGDRRIDKVIELCKPVDIRPDGRIVCMEDMRAVAVHLDALDLLGVQVARDVGALIDHEAFLPGFVQLLGCRCAVQTGAYD